MRSLDRNRVYKELVRLCAQLWRREKEADNELLQTVNQNANVILRRVWQSIDDCLCGMFEEEMQTINR